jgi:hypothetical protein
VVNFVGLELLHRRFLVLFIESGCWVSLIYGDCMDLADFLCYRGSRRGTVVVVKST